MKKSIKLFAAFVSLFTISSVAVPSLTVHAEEEEIFESDKIPFWMPNDSVLHYIDDTHFVVENITLDEKTKNEIRAGIDDIQSLDESTVSFVPGAPEKGITIYYSDEGELASIKNADGSSFDKTIITGGFFNEEISPMASDEHQLALFASWGNNNRLYRERGTGMIWGYGNASIFYDKIGDHDNVLKKGDCATQMNYDNCKSGTKVTVTVGSYSHEFTKNDVGALPNAVVDIWKDGVKYLGGTDKEIANNSFLKSCGMRHNK